jgi:hypothetical protein
MNYLPPDVEPQLDDADWKGHRNLFWRLVWQEVVDIARARGLHFLAGLILGIAAGWVIVPLP